jgi:hypothetical protein
MKQDVPLPMLPRDVIIYHLILCLTIQDKLLLIANCISRDWCTWARSSLHIDVRRMQITVEAKYSLPVVLFATEQVTSSDHLVVSSDGQWVKHENIDGNDTKECSERNLNRYGHHLCYQSTHPFHLKSQSSSTMYQVSAEGQAGMTECIQILMAVKNSTRLLST